MTEQERLKRICDEIWYEWPFYYDDNWYFDLINSFKERRIDVREIIFTTEFREYLYDYLSMKKNDTFASKKIEELVWHLNSLTSYLYNLIFNK